MNEGQARELEHALNSPAGRVAWVVMKAVITVFIAAMIGIMTSYAGGLKTELAQQGKINTEQKYRLIMMDKRVDAIDKRTEATVSTMKDISSTLNAHAIALTKLTDAIKSNTATRKRN